MRILADRHHSDLYYSLQRLFEDRLGCELYTPLGLEWWTAGIWRFGECFGDDRLARQYLNIDAKYREVEPGLFITFDQCHPEHPIYGVTLERARTMSLDFILASVQENQQGFHNFAQEIGAKYLYHLGNAGQGINHELSPLILDSTSRRLEGKYVHISQEFDSLSIFRFRTPKASKRITSFVNLLPQIPESYEPFAELSKLLPSYEFKSYGHKCPDGFLTPVASIAEKMARSSWAYHDKPTGDGFGHCIHSWAAIGRPLIGHARYYEGQRSGVFWRDGETCIDLDNHSTEEAAQIITETSPKKHQAMCEAIRMTFEDNYHPDIDAQSVAILIGIGVK